MFKSVKVQYLDPRCSGVEVKVLGIGNTQIKHEILKMLLTVSTVSK